MLADVPAPLQFNEAEAREVMDLRPTDAITDPASPAPLPGRARRGRDRVLVALDTARAALPHRTTRRRGDRARSRTAPDLFLEEVEWATLVFFMGLFILVGGLVEVG